MKLKKQEVIEILEHKIKYLLDRLRTDDFDTGIVGALERNIISTQCSTLEDVYEMLTGYNVDA